MKKSKKGTFIISFSQIATVTKMFKIDPKGQVGKFWRHSILSFQIILSNITDLGRLIGNFFKENGSVESQHCRNLAIFLRFWFYVKSILPDIGGFDFLFLGKLTLKFRADKLVKMAVLGTFSKTKIDFNQNLSGSKILKLPHSEIPICLPWSVLLVIQNNFWREILTMMEFLQTSLGAQCVFESCRSH